MKSRWYEIKPEALKLRKNGKSIRYVESKLGIPRSTLSGWFKEVKLTKAQKLILEDEWKKSLTKARKKAVLWHNAQKAERLLKARDEAAHLLGKLNIEDKNLLELALSFLYLGEGFKKSTNTALGNSDPLILKFFVAVLKKNYNLSPNKIKCELHLRADQNPVLMKKFWSRELKIPLTNFTGVSVDSRTLGKKTYSYYKGVCVLRCGNVAIQRKLMYLSEGFCNKVISDIL